MPAMYSRSHYFQSSPHTQERSKDRWTHILDSMFVHKADFPGNLPLVKIGRKIKLVLQLSQKHLQEQEMFLLSHIGEQGIVRGKSPDKIHRSRKQRFQVKFEIKQLLSRELARTEGGFSIVKNGTGEQAHICLIAHECERMTYKGHQL